MEVKAVGDYQICWEGGSRVGNALTWPYRTCVKTIQGLPQTHLLCVIWAVVKVALVLVAIIPSLILAAPGALINRLSSASSPMKRKPNRAAVRNDDEINRIDIMAFARQARQAHGKDLTAKFQNVLNKQNQASFREVKLYIQNICHVVTNDPSKGAAAVEILYTKLQNCDPTWHNGARDAFYDVCGAGGAEQKILRYVQTAKETILDTLVADPANPQWHTMNWVRRHRHRRWGLSEPVADRYIDNYHRHITLARVDRTFHESYTAEALINLVCASLQRDFPGMGDLAAGEDNFIDVLKQESGIDGVNELLEAFFTQYDMQDRFGNSYQQFQINEAGTAVLLKAFGILR